MTASAFSAPHAWLAVEADVTGLVHLRSAQQGGVPPAPRRRPHLPAVHGARRLRSRSSSTRTSTPRGARTRSSCGSGSTSASPSPRTAGCSSPSSATPTASASPASRWRCASSARETRNNKLQLDDVQGGTFTLDNTGAFGSIISHADHQPGPVRDHQHGGDHQAAARSSATTRSPCARSSPPASRSTTASWTATRRVLPPGREEAPGGDQPGHRHRLMPSHLRSHAWLGPVEYEDAWAAPEATRPRARRRRNPRHAAPPRTPARIHHRPTEREHQPPPAGRTCLARRSSRRTAEAT